MGDLARKLPARVVGRCALYDEIAVGGMATVCLGRMQAPAGFAPIVAVKCMRSVYARNEEFVAMFLDEARLASRVRHPNIAPVLDVVREGDEVFLVMEYVHGESLARLVRPGAAVSPSVACAVACGVLEGLHAAHEATDAGGEPLGIVHRDVSPQNVIVGVDGIARVIDFGVAKARGRAQATTKDGRIKGKLAYMPPEQLRAGTVNRQADVYAAAVVLWEMLTGQRLFAADDEDGVIERVLFGEVAPPSRLAPAVPAALDAVVLRALARERSERFSTAREMVLALQRCTTVASAPEVGAWVEGRVGDGLEGRAQLVRQIGLAAGAAADGASGVQPTRARVSQSAIPTVTDAAAAAPKRARRKGAARVALGASAALVVGCAVVVGARLARSAAVAPPNAAATPATPPTAATAATAPPESQDPPPASEPQAPSAPAKPAAEPRATAASQRPTPRATRADGCDPPFTRDAQGRKVYKRQCL